MTPIIQAKKITKTYQSGSVNFQALNGVDLIVPRGAFMTITGPSGSGKSTLLNIIGLLDSPTTGEIYLDGKPFVLDDFDRAAEVRSHKISFIFQSFNLVPVLTLEENVMLPLVIRKDLTQKEKDRRVSEWIEKVGLEAHRKHQPDELSGGQRQRVSIARAMVTEPELVLADEPTANLDSKTAQSILELMKKLNEERKTTFIFSTHDPSIQKYAAQRVQIKDGIIIEDSLGSSH